MPRADDFANGEVLPGVGPIHGKADRLHSATGQSMNSRASIQTGVSARSSSRGSQAQGRELLAGPVAADLPVVVVGDFNSPADGKGTPSYAELTEAGFDDAWLDAGRGESGLTCCHATSLRNPADTLDRRTDLILTRGEFRAACIDVVGDEPADMVGGLWPSDHAGVVATLNMPRPGRSEDVP